MADEKNVTQTEDSDDEEHKEDSSKLKPKDLKQIIQSEFMNQKKDLKQIVQSEMMEHRGRRIVDGIEDREQRPRRRRERRELHPNAGDDAEGALRPDDDTGQIE